MIIKLHVLLLLRHKSHRPFVQHRHCLEPDHRQVDLVVCDALVDPELVAVNDGNSVLAPIDVGFRAGAKFAVPVRPVARTGSNLDLSVTRPGPLNS